MSKMQARIGGKLVVVSIETALFMFRTKNINSKSFTFRALTSSRRQLYVMNQFLCQLEVVMTDKSQVVDSNMCVVCVEVAALF